MNKYLLYHTDEFEDWHNNLDTKTRDIIRFRLERLEIYGHFGHVRIIDGIIELKWGSGFRVYLCKLAPNKLMILYGGNKNGQDRDIQAAKRIKKREIENI